MRYVYLIQSLENGYYKIGISKNNQKRLRTLQTGNSSEIKIVETYLSEVSNLIEKALHRRYSHNKKEGEWFNLSIEIESTFIEECKKIEDSINVLKKNDNVFI